MDIKKNPNDKNNKDDKSKFGKHLAFFIIVLIFVSLFFSSINLDKNVMTLTYSEFLNEVKNGNIKSVELSKNNLNVFGTFSDNVSKNTGKKNFKTYSPQDYKIIDRLIEGKVEIKSIPEKEINWFLQQFLNLLPFIFIIALWLYIMNRIQGGGKSAMSFGKSRAKLYENPTTTFNDVAGIDEAQEELEEIVEFLKQPEKFKKIGAKIPKGCLLIGGPGTGKTLLAKAIAGEAKVPFFSISGSDFVEMFVGVGASRVRDLFEQARKKSPSIIFVDEIDAVGRQRGAGLGGGHDEREQTLNQLLVEMDGFDSSEFPIIMIAATNRPDILDPALLRPGRFDRKITVDAPDIKGRKKILKIHSKNVPMDKEVDLEIIAKRTPGFVGADLANVINEAALLSARRQSKVVRMKEIEDAIDRVLMGPERKSHIMSKKEKYITAIHEVGHALIAKKVEHSDPVHKVTIVSRGRALGVTLTLPTDDKVHQTRSEIVDRIKVYLGGRIAEQLIFDEISSGAANDLKQLTKIAHAYVCQLGMSKKIGNISLVDENSEVFLGRDFARSKNYSDKVAFEIDMEIRRLINDCEKEVTRILTEHRDKLLEVSDILVEVETLSGAEIDEILHGNFDMEKIKEDRREKLNNNYANDEEIDSNQIDLLNSIYKETEEEGEEKPEEIASVALKEEEKSNEIIDEKIEKENIINLSDKKDK